MTTELQLESPPLVSVPSSDLLGFPAVLDACCGSRMFWYDKQDKRALYVDVRQESHVIDIGTPGTIGRKPVTVAPDLLADFTKLPLPDNTFALVVFDPPHLTNSGTGIINKKYGVLEGDWREMLQRGFSECFRVLRPEGTLIFKWAETQYPVSEILKLTPHKPLFGHLSGKKLGTHWVAFIKPNSEFRRAEPERPVNPKA
jgi:SAM-dependent methyltransferase